MCNLGPLQSTSLCIMVAASKVSSLVEDKSCLLTKLKSPLVRQLLENFSSSRGQFQACGRDITTLFRQIGVTNVVSLEKI